MVRLLRIDLWAYSVSRLTGFSLPHTRGIEVSAKLLVPQPIIRRMRVDFTVFYAWHMLPLVSYLRWPIRATSTAWKGFKLHVLVFDDIRIDDIVLYMRYI